MTRTLPARVVLSFLCLAGLAGLLACSGRPTADEASDACAALCVGGGFSGGAAKAYGDGLDTCVCAGLGDGLTESACVDYCLTYEVDASGAQLTTDADDDDTCTCNATQ